MDPRKAAQPKPQVPPTRRGRDEPRRNGWLADPRSYVLFILAAVVGIGGGRRLWKSRQASRAVDRLSQPELTPELILDAAQYGRAPLIELFRLLAEAQLPANRLAAGRALAKIWAQDDLIAEEEQAVVRRGFVTEWNARRKYPRQLTEPIPFEIPLSVPFLGQDPDAIQPQQLEWSWRVTGTHRAHLESFGPWTPGPCSASFKVDPRDYPTNGPHRLVLQTRVRTTDSLTSNWQFELPHLPFQFEFDPILALDSLFALPDASRAERLAQALAWVPAEDPDLPITPEFLIHQPPRLTLSGPLDVDLAHRITLQFQDSDHTISAGQLVSLAQGRDQVAQPPTVPLGPTTPAAAEFERPGIHLMRAILRPDPQLGWTHPGVRSIWPGELVTDWVEVRLVRR
jgi:hypothetical protein